MFNKFEELKECELTENINKYITGCVKKGVLYLVYVLVIQIKINAKQPKIKVFKEMSAFQHIVYTGYIKRSFLAAEYMDYS